MKWTLTKPMEREGENRYEKVDSCFKMKRKLTLMINASDAFRHRIHTTPSLPPTPQGRSGKNDRAKYRSLHIGFHLGIEFI